MANYDIICPIKHPLKCHLSSVEKEQLEGPGKYTAFFMYQLRKNDRKELLNYKEAMDFVSEYLGTKLEITEHLTKTYTQNFS
ncbi:hypothetical protein ES703_68046 [subsurface metagenome]